MNLTGWEALGLSVGVLIGAALFIFTVALFWAGLTNSKQEVKDCIECFLWDHDRRFFINIIVLIPTIPILLGYGFKKLFKLLVFKGEQ